MLLYSLVSIKPSRAYWQVRGEGLSFWWYELILSSFSPLLQPAH